MRPTNGLVSQSLGVVPGIGAGRILCRLSLHHPLRLALAQACHGIDRPSKARPSDFGIWSGCKVEVDL
jgi:hypothetical protein